MLQFLRPSTGVGGYRLMVGCDLPKVETRVRFPLPAPSNMPV